MKPRFNNDVNDFNDGGFKSCVAISLAKLGSERKWTSRKSAKIDLIGFRIQRTRLYRRNLTSEDREHHREHNKIGVW